MNIIIYNVRGLGRGSNGQQLEKRSSKSRFLYLGWDSICWTFVICYCESSYVPCNNQRNQLAT